MNLYHGCKLFIAPGMYTVIQEMNQMEPGVEVCNMCDRLFMIGLSVFTVKFSRHASDYVHTKRCLRDL